MKKQLLSTLLVLCMVLAMLPGTAQAADVSYPVTGGNIYFDATTGTITDCDENVTEVIIPHEINGTVVTSIGSHAFSDCSWLISLTIPDSVTSIGNGAFHACSRLISVNIPNSITKIESGVFEGCRSLTSLTIPNRVTSIGEHAFGLCEGLTNLIIPNSVTSIGDGAFYNCWNLTSMNFPFRITTIGYRTLIGCESLVSVNIPQRVTSIGAEAFDGCDSLADIYYSGNESQWKQISIGEVNDPLRNATIHCNSPREDHDILEYAVTGGNIYFNMATGTIMDHDENITAAIIPNEINGFAVTSIGDHAFYGCISLTSVTIPDSVTYIGDYAFQGCDRLTDVYLTDVHDVGNGRQWRQFNIREYNDPLLKATLHYNNSNANAEPEQEDSASSNSDPGNSVPSNNTPSVAEHIYDTPDPGEDVKLDANRLNTVTDSATATEAVRDMVSGMTQEQKESPTGIDLATLYAETAVAKAASKTMDGSDIVINAAAVSDVAAEAAQTLSAVEEALSNGGIATARELSQTVTLLTNETEITIRIDPDVLGTEVDKVCVETPGYVLTFKLSDLAPDLTGILTFKAAPANVETLSVKNAVDIEVPGGSMAASITVSLPTDKSTDTTYQAVVSSTGTTTASKYNPATTNVDGKVNASGTYTVETNEMDFTDITNKSTEMQKAIKYLAAHGIVMGSGGTNYSPNDSISRAELTALVLRALGKVDSKATTSFIDVTPANWFYATAASSQKLGYINGFEDNTFRGNITINKEQIVVISARVLGAEMNYTTPSNTAAYLSKYSDTVVSWAQPQVALATRENLVVYRTDGTFSGAKDMTRGDAAIIIYRLFQRIW